MIKKLIGLMFICSIAHSATYYIAPTGNDSTGNGSTGTPWATFNKAFASMSGGDTLILKDGTYTGDLNRIYSGVRLPPIGSAGAWTIIKAEHDGEAVIDGENARAMFNVDYNGTSTDTYWVFEGLLWANGTMGVGTTYANYVKFLRCGNSDESEGNSATFGIGRGRYCLFEGCYAYGAGRYKFNIFNSTACIVRNCVGRSDRVNAPAEPFGMFTVYGGVDVEIQNCIALDSDQDDLYTFGGELIGAFGNPVSGAAVYSTVSRFTNCVALNNHLGGGSVDAGYDATYTNCAWWDISTMGTPNNVFNIKESSATYVNCLFGDVTDYGVGQGVSFYYADMGDVRNSILYGFVDADGAALSGGGTVTHDYNCFYGNTVNYNGLTQGDNETINVNPIYNASTNATGGLKYVTRIESSSNLDGQGESGVDIGANVMTLIGTSGTLYGETGYNTDTGVSMWPFPNEDLIKTKMAAYTTTGVTGARGFAATGKQLNGTDDITLTSYIWEYLGNEMPAEIYGKSESVRRRLSISGGITITGGVQLK